MLENSNSIRNPGLRTLPPGVERYQIQGGGINVLEIFPEDKLEIINDEGRQICEIIAFNSKGKGDLSILSLKENSNGDYLKKAINQDEKILKLFKKKNLELNKSKSSIIFNKDCPMDEKEGAELPSRLHAGCRWISVLHSLPTRARCTPS